VEDNKKSYETSVIKHKNFEINDGTSKKDTTRLDMLKQTIKKDKN
jgi:hypothetical protein